MQSYSSSAISLLLTLLLVHFSSIQAQKLVSAPTPSLDCTTALLNLTSCLTYVTSGSNLTRPEKGCCSALAGVLENEVSCLCQLIAGYNNFGIQIDTVRVLELPTICRVNAPPSSLCSKAGAPTGSSSPPSNGPDEPSVPATTAHASSYGISSVLQLSVIALCLIL
ncbi:non-specific lipid-transfer protein-like protein [Carex littledalei]|uniref:Non-specific lipid-transfer protein-like protein n=1 Tax=Carex littledalei TaxID=544730 RepID=A0A833QP97_9POAL|nr:non-specific lipid-transfer protein-like protein [Carex littledalei]